MPTQRKAITSRRESRLGRLPTDSTRPLIACADNLRFMGRLPDGCCDLIYADPPFATQRVVNSRSGADASFADRFPGTSGYVEFLTPRLVEMHRLLSDRGSIFVHVDWRTSHHVRLCLDDMFGEDCFLNEIIWSYRGGARPGKWFPRKHDSIFWYAKRAGRHTFNPQRGGSYRTRDLQTAEDGTPYKSTRRGRIHFHRDGPQIGDVWDVPFLSTVSKERTGYPTQKPERLLARIILSASCEGDCVGDFFLGSGTCLVAATRLGRRAIGCDANPRAVSITRERLRRLRNDG